MNLTNSERAFHDAEKVLAGGVNSPVRAFKAVGGTPVFIDSAAGAIVTDLDGNNYVDFVASWGPMIAGHAHPKVVERLHEAVNRGTSYGTPTAHETELARRVVEMVPSIEQVRFVNSGTEATMSAIRLARAATKRPKIIKFTGCYHGHSDSLLSNAGSGVMTLGIPSSPGVTENTAADTISIPYNDVESVLDVFDQVGSEIAAIIVEPIAGNMGVIPPRMDFLKELRDITVQWDCLLIFDEVITGFRVARGGAQELYGVQPDLTCLGKILGGGLPVGAFGGERDLMDMLAPTGPVYQAGTLSGNPLAMNAGIATLDLLMDDNVYTRLERLGAELQESLEDAADSTGVPLTVNRVGSMLTAFFQNGLVFDFNSASRSDTDRYARYHQAMLGRGFYFAPSQFEATFVSLAHSDKQIEDARHAARRVFREIAG